jgi:hypothetical protein
MAAPEVSALKRQYQDFLDSDQVQCALYVFLTIDSTLGITMIRSEKWWRKIKFA